MDRDTLVEAAVETTGRAVVSKAREFVRSLCLDELGPEELSRLQDMYRPPKSSGKRSSSKRGRTQKAKPEVPRVMLQQEWMGELPEGSESAWESGLEAAEKRREHLETHCVDEFWRKDSCPYKFGDIVVQVMHENNGRIMVERPGKVLYTQKSSGGGKTHTFVYIEIPRRNRIALDRLAKKLGKGSRKKLLGNGRIPKAFAGELLFALNG